MPALPTIPLNGLFPIEKPSGPTSMRVLDDLQLLMMDSRLFEDPERTRHAQGTLRKKRKKNNTQMGFKVGQGGTLDPLADGVLVVGVNRGTKYLQKYLEGTKEYESIGILGAATTTMDAEGPILLTGDFDKVTRQDVEKAIEAFQGKIHQTPPIFSALKMEGKPLYEYARANIPLPRAIPVRECTVSVELIDFLPAQTSPEDGTGHTYRWPTTHLSEEEKGVFRRLTTLVADKQASTSSEVKTDFPSIPEKEWPEVSTVTGLRPPIFKIRMTVSGGTYVRSIVHDIGTALGCGAHVVQLRRTRQGRFVLQGEKELEPLTEEQKREMSQALEGDDDGEEAAMNSAGVSSGEADLEDKTLETGVVSGVSTECLPWSTLERALEERKKIIEEQEADLEASLMGADPEVVKNKTSKEAKRLARRDGPLKEWEYEMLRRFIAVKVPASGSHGDR